MKYILDFDFTLLDTDAFLKVAMADGRTLSDCITPDIWEEFDVRNFLYPDVLPWLQSKPKDDLHILTACTPESGPLSIEFQKEKLYSGKFDELVSDITFMVGDKGSYVKKLFDGSPTCFVDDSLAHLESVVKLVPEVIAILMHRPGVEHVQSSNHSKIRTVHDLADLGSVLKNI